MKYIVTFLILMFMLPSPQTPANERVVLAEIFTSTTCPPCAPANTFFDNWLRGYANYNRVAVIKYHVWWPSPGNDPYYHANPLPVQTRNSYYGNNYAPRAFFDGTTDGGSSHGSWPTLVQNRINVPSQLQIEINGNIGMFGGTVNIKVTADGNEVPAGTLVLHTVVVESDLEYTGINNDPIHHHVMRQMYPDRNGETFELRSNETRYFTRNIIWNQNWERKNSSFVVFVQVRETKQVLQAVKRQVAVILPAPALVYPDFGANNIPASVELSWGGINKTTDNDKDLKPGYLLAKPNSAAFHLQVAKDANFNQLVIDNQDIAETSYLVENLESLTKYYWRVRAKIDGDFSPWSWTWEFNTGLGLPHQVSLLLPHHQSVLASDTVHFTWNMGTNVTSSYWFEYADNEEMNNAAVDSTITDTLLVLHSFEQNKEYWWRVRGKNDAGWGPFSESRSFSIVITSAGNLNIPEQFMLYQNFPNPFNPETVISYQLPEMSFVTLKVYDILGNEVALLVNETKPAGVYSVKFNADALPSGTYLYRISAGEFSQVKKLLLLK